MTGRRAPHAAPIVTIWLVPALVAACVGGVPTRFPATVPSGTPVASARPLPNPSEFWREVAPGGQSDETAASIDDLLKQADLVARVRPVMIRAGRDFVSPATGRTYYYATVEVEVLDTHRGIPTPNQRGLLNVEFYLGDDRTALERLAAAIPAEEVLIFLRNKAAEAASLGQDPDGPGAGRGYYRIAGPQGYVIDDGGTARTPSAEPGTELAALDGLPFNTIVDALPTVVPSPSGGGG